MSKSVFTYTTENVLTSEFGSLSVLTNRRLPCVRVHAEYLGKKTTLDLPREEVVDLFRRVLKELGEDDD